ncbi:hypothetical protein D3C71_1765150 [compost metagenome]
MQGSEQGLGGLLGIGHQRQLGQVVAHGLVRIDVDAQQAAGDFKATFEGHVIVSFGKLGTNRQNHIRFGHQLTGCRQRLGRTDLQRMAGGQYTLGVDGQRHRCLQVLRQAG